MCGKKKQNSWDIMFIGSTRYHLAKIIIFYCLGSLWAIMSFWGCSGDIPSASSLQSGKVTLSWDEVPGAVSYNVYGSTSPGISKLSGFKIRNVSNPITISHLQPGKTYYFVVTFVTDSEESKESKEMSYKAVGNAEGSIQFGDILRHPAPDALAKPQPAVKDSTPKTHDVTLAWDDIPNATSYNIYWSDKPQVTKKNGTKISNVKNPHKISGLKKGKKYYFVVTAVNASGESKESEELSFTVGQ